MLSDADLGALVLGCCKAKSPLGKLSNMQARVGGRRF